VGYAFSVNSGLLRSTDETVPSGQVTLSSRTINPVSHTAGGRLLLLYSSRLREMLLYHLCRRATRVAK
jgi:hypothetical protein